VRRAGSALAGLAIGLAAALLATLAAAQAAPAPPAEIDGQINGKTARFVAQGDDVLLAASEAERLGIEYREGKSLSIGGTPLWLVILNSVTVADRTRIGVQAGVVPSVPAYFAALRANPAEALARSREIQIEINGQKVSGYNLGSAGVLLSFDVAERAGVKYREGKRQDLGFVSAWVLEMPVKVGTQEGRAMVTVAEPEVYFKALMAGAARASSEPAAR
jgi:hypothetical protein